MKFYNLFRLVPMAVIFGSLMMACDNDDDTPPPINEEELITTVNLVFTNNADATDVVTASYFDEDGTGPTAPVVDAIVLKANSSYSVSVAFFNEEETPAENVTLEVRKEAKEHQIFFEVSDNLMLSHAYADDDDGGNGNPLGLENTFKTTSASTGTLRVILIHLPNKGADGVSDGNRANAGGEPDVDTTPPFPVTIRQ